MYLFHVYFTDIFIPSEVKCLFVQNILTYFMYFSSFHFIFLVFCVDRIALDISYLVEDCCTLLGSIKDVNSLRMLNHKQTIHYLPFWIILRCACISVTNFYLFYIHSRPENIFKTFFCS